QELRGATRQLACRPTRCEHSAPRIYRYSRLDERSPVPADCPCSSGGHRSSSITGLACFLKPVPRLKYVTSYSQLQGPMRAGVFQSTNAAVQGSNFLSSSESVISTGCFSSPPLMTILSSTAS